MVEIAEIEVAPDGRSLTITIGNAGQTNLFVYERFDVIIEYTDNGSGTWSVEALGFVPESPLAGQWAVTAITPDTIEPGFFNPGEQLTQLLHLTGEIQPLTANRVIVVTPNGASVTAQFTRE
jgi:hypothetical protein